MALEFDSTLLKRAKWLVARAEDDLGKLNNGERADLLQDHLDMSECPDSAHAHAILKKLFPDRY